MSRMGVDEKVNEDGFDRGTGQVGADDEVDTVQDGRDIWLVTNRLMTEMSLLYVEGEPALHDLFDHAFVSRWLLS